MVGNNWVGFKVVLIFCTLTWASSCDQKQDNPVIEESKSMVFRAGSILEIQQNADAYSLFATTLEDAKKVVNAEIAQEMDVPVPKDLAGGYTHNKHKRNYAMMQKAGKLYKITREEKYAKYIETMLLKYAELFPTLGLHPVEKSYTRGKLFWQCLNDANWLVYSSQAYDCVYDYMSVENRAKVENDLFRPYADFLSIETPHFFNRIHNHSTWACAGVGMIGLVMGDEELVQRALYGLKDDGINSDARDNDGGVIKEKGQRAGFLAQMELLFSPDGFYAEGPYYQRYAMYPFVVFAASLENARPELKIFEHRDGILIKSVKTLLNLTDSDGEFYPINDAQKGMSYYSRELVSAVDIVYSYGDQDPSLLSIVKKQGVVLLDATGYDVAKGITEGKEKPLVLKSVEFTDGADGGNGGLGILRADLKGVNINVVHKYTAQGMGHGHFDKLAISIYKDGKEVLQDYGVARFVNIEQKDGGGYLKENKTFSKQTVAHNTLVVNKKSNFKGSTKRANDYHSDRYFFEARDSYQVSSAKEVNAYPGVNYHRTLATIIDDAFMAPVVLDIMRVESDKENEYDLPYYYFGQLMSSNSTMDVATTLNPMGEGHGYQHLWLEATGELEEGNSRLTWMNDHQFYSLTSVSSTGDEIFFARIGANDPEFNLRNDPVFIYNREAKNTTFVSTIESHGDYSPVTELSSNAFSELENIELLHDSVDYTAVELRALDGTVISITISNQNNTKDAHHELSLNGELISWDGPVYYRSIKKKK